MTLFCLWSLHGSAFSAASIGDTTNPWPQWRGPEGLGVSSEPNMSQAELPVTWSAACGEPGRADSSNIKWKTFIPGQGHSSPIVSNGRVILTTAYESPLADTLQVCVKASSISLMVVFLAVLTLSLLLERRSRKKSGVVPADCSSRRTAGLIIHILTLVIFFCSALLITVAPQSGTTVGVFSLIGRGLARLGLKDVEHLCSMAEGVPAAVWLTSGSVALFGLVVAVRWLRVRPFWRLPVIAVILVSAIGLLLLTPLDQWKEKTKIGERLLFLAPALILLLWNLVGWIEIKSEQPLSNRPSASLSARINNAIKSLNYVEIRWVETPHFKSGICKLESANPVLFVLLSLLVFVPPNFLQPRLGLQRVVVCLDMGTGKVLWQRTAFVAPPERIHSDNSYATPTAAADGEHIIVNFGLGVAALDFDGNVLWRQNDPAYIRNCRYGATSSPVLVDGKAVVLQERENFGSRPTWLAAFDVRTGDCLWKVSPDNVRGCYTTPLVYREPNGPTQLLIASWAKLVSFDLQTGQQLWFAELPTEQLVANPARSDTLLCVAGGTWGRNAIAMLRLRLRTAPSPAPIGPLSGPPSSNTSGPDSDGQLVRGGAETLWQTDRDTPTCCSPLIYRGKLFVLTGSGKLTCYNAQTGQILQSKRLKGGRYLASPVIADGKLYVCSTSGLTTVIAVEPPVASTVEPVFRVLAENRLDGRCYASPAIAQGRILLRISGHLYCIEGQ